MSKWIPTMSRLGAILAGAAITVAAIAAPELKVSYDGANAAEVELRINGEAAGKAATDAGRDSGEVSFPFELDIFAQGDNRIEAVFYAEDGKSLGSYLTTLFAQRQDNAPVFIRLPKMGDSVQGTIEIQVGFGIEMRDTFVSFFVNNEFKAMRNFPPYTFFWDTTKETNGWHQVEVWAFDHTQTTRKSVPVRVLVNNPGGRTERVFEGAVSGPGLDPKVGEARGMKPGSGQPASQSGRIEAVTPSGVALLSIATLLPPTGNPAGGKVTGGAYAEMSGFRVSSPSTTVVTEPRIEPPLGPEAVAAASAPRSGGPIHVEFGTRLPNGAYTIYLEGTLVDFDVQPRVEAGIALTPFRHLYEHAGGVVDWDHFAKVVTAKGLGPDVWIKIGDLFARVDGNVIQLERAPLIEKGRTIVPLSFILSTLPIDIQFDPDTGHVLITSRQNK